jgi:betaine-aldehyde dehydrogenase
VAKVSLTGSVPTGRKVYAAAAAGLKHATMELGGKSPLIVFDDAERGGCGLGAINANFYSTGQICSNGTRVFVQDGIRDRFLNRLTERTKSAVIGDPMDEATHIGPMVSERAARPRPWLRRGRQGGGRAAGPRGGSPNRSRLVHEPAVFAGVTDEMTIARDEIFGPVMSVLTSRPRTR